MPAAAMDPQVCALAARVRVEVDQTQEGKFVPATVRVRTALGGRAGSDGDAASGHAIEPDDGIAAARESAGVLWRGRSPDAARRGRAVRRANVGRR